MLFLSTFLLLKKPLQPQRFLFSILLYSCFFAHPGYYGHRALSKFVFGNCLVLKKCFQCLKLCFQQIFHVFNPGRRFLRLCNDIHPCLNLLMNIVVVSDLYYTRPVKKSISTTRTRNRWIFLFFRSFSLLTITHCYALSDIGNRLIATFVAKREFSIDMPNKSGFHFPSHTACLTLS